MSAWRELPKVGTDTGDVRGPRPQRSVVIYTMGWFLGLGMRPTDTFPSLASESSVVEVRDHHPEVRLGMLINLVYNMYM